MMTSSKVGRNFQKLMIKFTNAPVLDEVLFLQKTLIESVAKFQKAIIESSRAVMRWGQAETNFTFSDVLTNWFDLDNALWLLLQELHGEFANYRQVFKGIKEEERIMCELMKKKESKANEVYKLKLKVNALKKASKKPERLDTLESELMLAEQEDKRMAEELNAFVEEFEKTKARTIKNALEVYSKGWLTFAQTSSEIFTAQSQIAEEMPSKPVIFEDQVTDANEMLVRKTFHKLNLQKPEQQPKPAESTKSSRPFQERETKAEISPQPRKTSADFLQHHTEDHHKSSIFSSFGTKLPKFSHKTSKECLVEEPSTSISRPLPQVPPEELDEDEFDDDPSDDDEYTVLNNDNLDEENYVVPEIHNGNGGSQYTFLVQDMDQPRYPPGIKIPTKASPITSSRMEKPRFSPAMKPPTKPPPSTSPRFDQPKYPSGFLQDIGKQRLSTDISYPSADTETEFDFSDDTSYLAVMADGPGEDMRDSDLIYEDLNPSLPPPRPPKKSSLETTIPLTVPDEYSGSANVFVPPPVPQKKTSPNLARKLQLFNPPDVPDSQKVSPKPQPRPRPRRAPPTLPPPVPPPELPPKH
ncbi:uncharacterized protein [Antedon mediterranea]|uniref:uncharacterized protein n=1 Tax=Antedon mediterranea TaxID=105859 RepID=UPI003AF6029E